jgi:hypothetical protein
MSKFASRFKRPNGLHHFVLPHASNGFKPKIIGIASLTVVLLFVIVLEGSYVFDTRVALTKPSFLASVLPGVLISLTNQERAANGVGQLTENTLLDQAAQLKANDEAAKGYFAHVSPDGTEPWHWIEAAGYNYLYAGENLAINFDDSSQVEQAWMNSPTHRANIVKPEYTDIGIAVAQGMYEGKETTFVVQYFASPGVASTTPQPVQLSAALASVPIAPATTTSVLGAQTQSTSAKLSVSTISSTSTTTSTTTALAAVANTPPTTPITGVHLPPPAEPTGVALIFAKIAASPTGAITYALIALLVLTAFLFIIALVAHLRVPYLEALGGTFAVFAIVVGMLIMNATYAPHVGLPASNLSASVINAVP